MIKKELIEKFNLKGSEVLSVYGDIEKQEFDIYKDNIDWIESHFKWVFDLTQEQVDKLTFFINWNDWIDWLVEQPPLMIDLSKIEDNEEIID